MKLLGKRFTPQIIINNYKRVKVGGKNTINGKYFENSTNSKKFLIEKGFQEIKFGSKYHYLVKKYEDKQVICILQYAFKKYMKEILIFVDVLMKAYIIEYKSGKKEIKILEKKEQQVEGSVDIKLWAGPSLKREYELSVNTLFQINYAFCVSEFLWKKLNSNDKKYEMLNTIFKEHSIQFFYGSGENYFENIYTWIHS